MVTDFLDFLIEFLRSLGLREDSTRWVILSLTIVGLVFSGGFVGYVLNVVQFRKRTFFDQMVIGVNILHESPDGHHTLQLRTLLENNLGALIDNPVLERMVVKAAKKCNASQPILKFKVSEDHALLLTKIQNAISSVFASEYILHMLGEKYQSQWVDFVVTCERYGGLKATKIRVLVFVAEDIKRLSEKSFFDNIQVEAAHHRDRLRTLRLIAANHLNGRDVVRGRVEILLRQEKLAEPNLREKPAVRKKYQF